MKHSSQPDLFLKMDLFLLEHKREPHILSHNKKLDGGPGRESHDCSSEWIPVELTVSRRFVVWLLKFVQSEPIPVRGTHVHAHV